MFSGISSAAQNSSGAGAELFWDPATDDTTAQSSIKYNIYKGWDAASIDWFNMVTYTMGANSKLVSNLKQGELYYLGVRAEDQAGNREVNTVSLPVRSGYVTPVPVVHYPFEGTLADVGPNGLDLVSGGTATAPLYIGDRFGVAGRAAQFNSSADYASVEDSGKLQGGGLTISLWVQVETLPTGEKPLLTYVVSASPTPIWELTLDNSGFLRFYFRDDSGGELAYLLGPYIVEGQLHHIAVVCDDSGLIIAKDNSTSPTATFSGTFAYPTGTSRLYLADYNSGFDGEGVVIDDVKIWSQKLDLTGLDQLYNAEKP